MTNNTQLELGLKAKPARRTHLRPSTRVTRAQWWFGKMREAVANAIDWQTESTPPARQIWLNESRRSFKA